MSLRERVARRSNLVQKSDHRGIPTDPVSGTAVLEYGPFGRSGEQPLQGRPAAVGHDDAMAQGMLASGKAAIGRQPLDAACGGRREEGFDALEKNAIVWHPRRVDQELPPGRPLGSERSFNRWSLADGDDIRARFIFKTMK